MTPLPAAIRKAAVLVSALDERSADALLDQMPAETATRVRNAVMQLGQVPSDEQDNVLAEFLRGGATASGRGEPDGGVELSSSLAERLAEQSIQPQPTVHTAPRPLDFLRHVPPRETSRILAREHRQTIALVIAQLEADIAAQVLEQLPPEAATDVLERMAWLAEPLPEVLADIERQLRAELAPYHSGGERAQSLANVQALVAAMDLPARQRVLTELGERNGALARELGYLPSERPVESPASLPGNLPGNYLVASYRYRLAPREATPREPTAFDDLLSLSDE